MPAHRKLLAAVPKGECSAMETTQRSLPIYIVFRNGNVLMSPSTRREAGKRIKRLRQEGDLSLREVALEAKCSQSTVQRIEKNIGIASHKNFRNVCYAVGTTPDELLKQMEEQEPTVEECMTQISRWVKRLKKAQGMK